MIVRVIMRRGERRSNGGRELLSPIVSRRRRHRFSERPAEPPVSMRAAAAPRSRRCLARSVAIRRGPEADVTGGFERLRVSGDDLRDFAQDRVVGRRTAAAGVRIFSRTRGESRARTATGVIDVSLTLKFTADFVA